MFKKSKQTKTDVPKWVNNTTLAKWNDSVKVHSDQVFGARKATLEYLLRKNDVVITLHPPLILENSYSAAAGYIQGKQTLRLSLNHPLYRDDNKSFFAMSEVASTTLSIRHTRGCTNETTMNVI